MKTAAIICEYNPFHNGHKYQIDEIKKEYGAVVCIMSGAFVQRGDVAVFDKWTRANAALLNGADLVVELPVCYALNTAERFAHGAVSLADKMCIVDALCFGSESGKIEELENAADIMLKETQDTSDKIKSLVSSGISYPQAYCEAYSEYINEAILKEPNNILAIEYIKALKLINSKIKPVTIKRKAVGHHDTKANLEFASASSVRNMIKENITYSKYVPDNVKELYSQNNFTNVNDLGNILLYILKTTPVEKIAEINDVVEGLENRLISAGNNCSTFTEVCEYVKSKRYTYAKISRILLSLILKIDKTLSFNNIEYLRVLGMNKTGMSLLSKIKEKSELTIITKPSDFKNFNKSFELDVFSGEIFSLCNKDNKNKFSDYTNSPVIIK